MSDNAKEHASGVSHDLMVFLKTIANEACLRGRPGRSHWRWVTSCLPVAAAGTQ